MIRCVGGSDISLTKIRFRRTRSPKCGDEIVTKIHKTKNVIQTRISQKYKKRRKKNKYSQFNLNLVATRKIRDFVVY